MDLGIIVEKNYHVSNKIKEPNRIPQFLEYSIAFGTSDIPMIAVHRNTGSHCPIIQEHGGLQSAFNRMNDCFGPIESPERRSGHFFFKNDEKLPPMA